MQLKKYILSLAVACTTGLAAARDYPAALFNIYSDGVTLNTRSIQHAIDYIAAEGGGRLVFSVGRYLTGSFELKSNVTVVLHKGAVIMGSLNPFDYEKKNWTALIFARGARHIGITGEGIIDGLGQQVARQFVDVIFRHLMTDPLVDGRPQAPNRPALIYFHHSSDITVSGVTLKDAASWVEVYDHCRGLRITGIHVDSKAYWNNDGLDLVDCSNVAVTGCFIDADDDGICLKSFDARHTLDSILVRDCIIRSSANGIKFGTASHGTFTHIRIRHNKVYNTYRSAIALEAVDGGTIEDITVDSLEARRTGNLVLLRIGERVAGRLGQLKNVRFRHLKAVIPATKPDAGYPYEGPVEDGPRNVSPAIIIAGLPGAPVSDISLEDVEIDHPGGGDSMYAAVPLDSLQAIPEYPDHYPEFSMFKELPAWGVFIRHASRIRFKAVRLGARKPDFRTPVVLNDVQDAELRGLTITPAAERPVFTYQCRSVTVE